MYRRKITALERETAHEYIRELLMDRGLKYELEYRSDCNTTHINVNNGQNRYEIVWHEVENIYETMHNLATHVEKEYNAPVESMHEYTIDFLSRGYRSPKKLDSWIRGNRIENFTFNYKDINSLPPIDDVIFNNPATIVLWSDGTKTVVKATDEAFDEEKGLAMAICKKIFGNKGNYFNEIKKWLPKIEEGEDE